MSATPSFRLQIVSSLDSTNAELLRRPLEEASPGVALLALRQTGGRGRSERVWESPSGGMYLSVVLSPSEPGGLALLGAKALLHLLQELGLSPQLRWPNDVMVGRRKIGGVLPVVRYRGNRLERAVLGVGLNVDPSGESFSHDLRPHLTTLAWELGEARAVPAVALVAERYLDWLGRELAALEVGGLGSYCRSCEPYLEGLGEVAVLMSPGQTPRVVGEVMGLSEDGALRLASGTCLDSLGRDERLRFAHECA